MHKTYYAHGKLLITGEYLVLDNAKALALPTKLGQKLSVKNTDKPGIKWSSFLADGSLWFSQEFNFDNQQINYKIEERNLKNEDVIKNLNFILQEVFKLSSKLDFKNGYEINSFLEFPRDWGLGSSSTLIHNLSQWAQINPYQLLKKTFGGSGYDIACADRNTPIIYQRNEENPFVKSVSFQPHFNDQIFFVYLNQKKNSREAIQHYRSLDKVAKKEATIEINKITDSILDSTIALSEFEQLINKHEEILSKVLKTPTIKEQLFKNYKGSIKSLGGWGGDFILATGSFKMMSYFKDLGYTTIIPFSEMVFNNNTQPQN